MNTVTSLLISLVFSSSAFAGGNSDLNRVCWLQCSTGPQLEHAILHAPMGIFVIQGYKEWLFKQHQDFTQSEAELTYPRANPGFYSPVEKTAMECMGKNQPDKDPTFDGLIQSGAFDKVITCVDMYPKDLK
jgi:hypothetical protein